MRAHATLRRLAGIRWPQPFNGCVRWVTLTTAVREEIDGQAQAVLQPDSVVGAEPLLAYGAGTGNAQDRRRSARQLGYDHRRDRPARRHFQEARTGARDPVHPGWRG